MKLLNLCQCGCGREANTNRKFVMGHNTVGHIPWNKGIKTGPMSQESKAKVTASNIRSWASLESRKKRIESLKRTAASKTLEQRKLWKNAGNNNPAKRPEVRRKISETLKRKYENMECNLFQKKYQNPNVFSDIEKLVANVLTELKISFEHNKRIGRFTVDFVIYENVIIECDGFWHDNELRKQSDLKRDEYLKNRGFAIFHLHWKDIQSNVVQSVSKILESRK